MTPEKETELFATLASIMTLLQQQGQSLREQGQSLREQGQCLREQGERLARIEGILANSPQTAEFYELRGRVEEISRRLPTTLAYSQPQARV